MKCWLHAVREKRTCVQGRISLVGCKGLRSALEHGGHARVRRVGYKPQESLATADVEEKTARTNCAAVVVGVGGRRAQMKHCAAAVRAQVKEGS